MLNSKIFRLILLIFLLSLLITPHVYSEELDNWPRDMKISSGTITIYQPQVESLKGHILTGRAAVAYHGSGSDTPIFGAVWFTTQVNIDRENSTCEYSKYS